MDIHKPWICAGDFNELLYHSDKSGDCSHNSRYMQLFKDFLQDKHMEELPQRGIKFTWCNNRSIGTVQEKPDRCIVNWERRKMHPNAVVTALPPISSDHSPLIIEASPSPAHGDRIFKLEPYWAEHEAFTAIVEKNWISNIQI